MHGYGRKHSRRQRTIQVIIVGISSRSCHARCCLSRVHPGIVSGVEIAGPSSSDRTLGPFWGPCAGPYTDRIPPPPRESFCGSYSVTIIIKTHQKIRNRSAHGEKGSGQTSFIEGFFSERVDGAKKTSSFMEVKDRVRCHRLGNDAGWTTGRHKHR